MGDYWQTSENDVGRWGPASATLYLYNPPHLDLDLSAPLHLKNPFFHYPYTYLYTHYNDAFVIVPHKFRSVIMKQPVKSSELAFQIEVDIGFM